MPRTKPKLTVEERLDLIEEYKICFEGPIPAGRWPVQYQKIFEDIRNIQRMRYDEYEVNESRDLITVAAMKRRVRELNQTAYDCRKKRENEDTWRARIEPQVVSRFGEEVVCQICDKRLWQSEFRAVPDDPNEAEDLRRRRAKRTSCECDPLIKASEDFNKRGEESLFTYRIGDWVRHDPDDNLLDRGLRLQRPDRVFGLEKTEVFKKYLPRRPYLRHSPFEDRNVLFPFLIIEAKSEKGSAGFESIESQTAFPIRTLVKLQRDLQRGSGVSMNPLVWFLANRGEEWRVYACVLDGSNLDEPASRVIDLWHGTVLSQDCALQLLQIIDTICDWARDIYRKNVLHCLAGGEVNMRDLTPYTVTSDNDNALQEHDRRDIWSVPTTPTLARPVSPSLIDLTELADELLEDFPEEVEESSEDAEDFDEEFESPNEEIEAIDIDMQDVHLTRQDQDRGSPLNQNEVREGDQGKAHMTNLDDSHPLLRFSRIHPDSSHWSRHVTIRHSNIVLFSFRHVALPEDIEALGIVLSRPEVGKISMESRALNCWLALKNGVMITPNGIHLLEQSWTRTTRQAISEDDRPIHASIELKAFLRAEDWQLMKVMMCITASRRAMESLRILSGTISPRYWDVTVHCCPCLLTDTQAIRSLRDEPSATMAALNIGLSLELSEQSNGEMHFSWARKSGRLTGYYFGQDWSFLNRQCALEPHYHQSSCFEELLLRRSAPDFLEAFLKEMGSHGAILLKKGRYGWPKTSPDFCLLVFDNSDFEDAPSLGRKIIRVCDAGDTYMMCDGEDLFMVRKETKRYVLDAGDKATISAWVDILEGRSRTASLSSLP